MWALYPTIVPLLVVVRDAKENREKSWRRDAPRTDRAKEGLLVLYGHYHGKMYTWILFSHFLYNCLAKELSTSIIRSS